MAYYLAVERNPNSHEAINIKQTIKGKKMFPNDERHECTLEEIDRFTTQYKSIEKLKYDLHNEKKIPYSNSPLSIIYTNGNDLKIEKSILFKESKQYLEKPLSVVAYIYFKFLNFDTVFSKELAEILPEISVRAIIEHLTKDIEESITYNMTLDVNKALHSAQSLVYNLDKDGLIIEPRTIDYEKLHNVVAFIADYENKIKEKSKTKNKAKTKNT